MQAETARKDIRMRVERILKKALPKESGAARLQQVGLFTLIYMLQGDDEPVTARRLAEMTGQSEGNISSQLKKLFDVRVIRRCKILNKKGRGYAWQLSIADNADSRRLVKAIEKAGIKKR
jgi:DNA-binding transcriptional regulator GbsR (MarR family)